jgi:large subunit ribosomal protein L24
MKYIFMQKINKMKIKKGDTVVVISGKDKGKSGKVLRTIPSIMKVVVENINVHTHFEKSKQPNKPGQKVLAPSPMQVSKLMLLDSNSGKTTRVGYEVLTNGTKQRIARKSGKAV